MSETPREPEPQLSVQPSPQPEPEGRLQPPPLFQLPVPTQDAPVTDQQTRLQSDQQLSELQPQAEPVFKYRLLVVLFSGFFICATIVGPIYYMNLQTQDRQADTVTPCLSPACQWASAHLSTSADPFKHPCDYFLSTCRSDRLSLNKGERQRGQDISGHPQSQKEKVMMPQGRPWSKESDKGLGEETIPDRKSLLLLYLRDILESNDSCDRRSLQKARGFYRSCLDTESIESAGAEPFLQLIQKLGGWAVSGQWNRTDFNSTLSLLMRDYATFPFFSLRVGRDPKETSNGTNKRYIQIDQPDLLIPIAWNSQAERSQAKTKTLRPFFASCQQYLALLGSPPSSSMIHVGTFISLSSELAVAASPVPYRRSKGLLYQRMTIRELQSQAPAIDWLGCLQAAFHPHLITEDDLVLLHNLPYIVQMSRIIGNWTHKHELRTSPLYTFMVLHLLHTLMPALDSRFSGTAKNLSLALGSGEPVAPRWKRCVLETETGFDQVLRNLLSERLAHKEAAEIIMNVFSSFKAKLQEQRWTNEKSIQMVIDKVESLFPRLWTTKDSSSEAELDLLFPEVSTQSFFSNYIQLLSLWQKRRIKLLTEQAEAADILSVTPYLLGNELLFPTGMFTPPLFHPTYPRALHYGVLGFLMAKDILHMMLSDIHSQSETVRAVGECVWAHYLSVTGKGGAFSLSAAQQQEVWVQYSALQIALRAYQQSLTEHPSDLSILGLSHTRLFLASFSQVYCDSDMYSEFMPLEPSFLIMVICAKSDQCPASLQCLNNTQQRSLTTC